MHLASLVQQQKTGLEARQQAYVVQTNVFCVQDIDVQFCKRESYTGIT